MKILNSQQLREADKATITREHIKSLDLMERAATRCYEWLYERAPGLFPKHITEEKDWLFQVVCGSGNNGGDGLAIARHLMRNGYHVEVFVVHLAEQFAPDMEANLNKLAKGKLKVSHVKSTQSALELSAEAIIIDALLGTGVNRPADGLAARAIEAMNTAGGVVVSIDLPSGLYDELDHSAGTPTVVKASYILSFQVPKLCLLLEENEAWVGEVVLLDIGLDPDYLSEVTTTYHLLTKAEAGALRQIRGSFSHKGTFGHCLILAGSADKYGAAILASHAALRAGAGLVTARVPSAASQLVVQARPEVMTSTDTEAHHLSTLPDLSAYNSIAIGPGIGQHSETQQLLKLLIQQSHVPLVIDADGLTILAENPTWLSFLPKHSILTPHPGEFFRLTGKRLNHFDRMEKQREWSKKYGILIVLKGGHSSLSLPDGRVLINTTGNPGMATAGMGDALTGIIAGLLAAGYLPADAAALGMYVHGLAGDCLLSPQSVESITASDLIESLGTAFNQLAHA